MKVVLGLCLLLALSFSEDKYMIFQGAPAEDETDLCASMECGPLQTCEADESLGTAECVCPECETQFEVVCGTDCNTYFDPCQIDQKNCHTGSNISVWTEGMCFDPVLPEITSVSLVVGPFGRNILTELGNKIRVPEGGAFILECEATGSPPPSIFWFKDGEQVHEGGLYAVSKAILEDQGVYTCQAKICIGGDNLKVQESEEIQISVDAAEPGYEEGDADEGPTPSENPYEESYDNWMEDFLKEVTSGIDLSNILDDSTGSGLSEGFEMGLMGFKEDMCFPIEGECEGAMFLGCNCINGFKAQEEQCAKIPCNIHTYLYNNLAAIITEFTTIKTTKDLAELVTGRIYKPLMMTVCDCQSALASSTVNCVQNYDGGIMMMMGDDFTAAFEALMQKVDFESVQKLIEDVLGVHCVKYDGEYCYPVLSESLIIWSQMVDMSFSDNADYCGTFKRVREEFYNYTAAFKQDWTSAVMDYNPKAFGGMLQTLIKAWYKLEENSWCNEQCSRQLAKAFFSCCSYAQSELASQSVLYEDLLAVMENIFAIISQGKEFPKINKATMSLVTKGHTPLKMCKINNSVKDYRRAKRKCDAITPEM